LDGCKESPFIQLLQRPEICGNTLSPLVRYSLVSLPFSPTITLVYGAILIFFEGRAMFAGMWYQILLQAVGGLLAIMQGLIVIQTTLLIMQDVANAPTMSCGFLLSNVTALAGSNAVAVIALISVMNKMGHIVQSGSGRGKNFVLWIHLPPQLVVVALAVVALSTTLALVVSGFPALVGLIHIVVIQLLIGLVVPVAVGMLLRSWIINNQTRWYKDLDEDEAAMNNYQHYVKVYGLLAFVTLQLLQGLGILGWALYLTKDYKAVNSAYFQALYLGLPQIPAFNFHDFHFNFYFNWPNFGSIFEMQLYPTSLLGLALCVQLIHLPISLLQTMLGVCCAGDGGYDKDGFLKDVYVEMK
jgi:hypothetical protein